jgi:ATP-binding cassette subfamily F protein 3
MLYQITDGSISAGGNVILSHFDFEIKGNEKIAVVGRNGAGKTTLLRLIAGELDLDRDDRRNGPGIVRSRRVTIGMLRQQVFPDPEKTVEEELLADCPARDTFERERFEYEQEYDRLFTGFGFTKADKRRHLGSFSGGEQTKIGFIRLLLAKPDILLLDEPTNNLDVSSCEWLEEYLRSYEHAVVMVSHDRFFLDRVADVVYEAANHTLTRYAGNYTHYREEKRKRIALQQKTYERQQSEIARLNEVIEKFKHKPAKASFARAKKKQIERMEHVDKPIADDVHIFAGEISPELPGSKIVLNAEHLRIGYEETGVLLDLSLRVRRGQKIGLIGPNGAGKSTFLKTVAGLIPPMPGDPLNLGKSGLTLGNQITIGYFDQHSAEIQSEKPVVEHFHDLFPSMTEKEVRSALGAYLFSGKDAARRVSDLSGGEKARLVLAELLQSRPNFLVLDEPTNHMDIQAKETLESAFQAYTGTILFVSHDRYFIRQVAESVMSFEDRQALYYPFGYEHYLDRVRRSQSEVPIAAQVKAEDQALIEGMRAVPKAERHRLREIPTEEAYLDWKLRLICEKMFPAADAYAELEEQYRQTEESWKMSEAYWTENENILYKEEWDESQDLAVQNRNVPELLSELHEARNQAFRIWHAYCLEYWDIYEGNDTSDL